MNLNNEINTVVTELMKLKDKGEVNHAAISYGVDRHNIHIEITLIKHGVEKKIASMFSKDAEGIAKRVMEKVQFVIRNIL